MGVRVVLTGGGTGGHIYPALAIAAGLRQKHPDWELIYFGGRTGLEKNIVPRADIPFYAISASGLERHLSWKAFVSLSRLLPGTLQGWRWLARLRPRVVVGTGGYVCAPVVLAATLARVPVLLHEQNALPGLTNRYFGRLARAICTSFPGCEGYFPRPARVHYTGLPVRPEIGTIGREAAARDLGVDPVRILILVVGGSQGARKINQAMLALHRELQGSSRVHLWHITGENGYQEVMEGITKEGIDIHAAGNITVVPYWHAMPELLAVADLVIGRAGATFMAELTLAGLPAILIPYPFAAENHQEYNARALARAGGAVVIPDGDLTGVLLWETVRSLLEDSQRRQRMAAASRGMARPRALEEIIEIIEEIAGGQA
ncbi:MAG: undecaprenyldiphospho-muramoylpentapeptide beta-N-acetylglucosaminyltransferase [Clostridia bacterium]|nr:MAG: undecaprenyldiphospho-muramoylpentapeptide beta-N-acetylglucosaminyltransferase [Clostridia bacterium]